MTDPRAQAAQELDSLLRRFSEWAIPKLATGAGDPEYWQARVVEAQAALAVLAVPPAEPQEAPRYDVRVAMLLDTEVQRLATLADETEGPAAERFVRQARYVSGVLDDVVERREPGPNATEELLEKVARGLYDHHVAQGGEVVAEWDFGPAEYMRHIFREQARAALEAALEGPGEGTAR